MALTKGRRTREWRIRSLLQIEIDYREHRLTPMPTKTGEWLKDNCFGAQGTEERWEDVLGLRFDVWVVFACGR